MAFALPDPRRIRSHLLRLPLATRAILALLTVAYFARLFYPGLEQWGALIPDEINLNSRTLLPKPPLHQTFFLTLEILLVYRLNTYPFLHKSILHYLLNTLSILPLLERFEGEHGTIVTIALFAGPFGLLPGALYLGVERGLLRGNTAAEGASGWVFLLLANEAVKTARANPTFLIRDTRIPTWTAPLLAIALVAVLFPGSSALGHICGAVVGYVWASGYIRFLAPHDRLLRWIETKFNLLARLPHYVSVDQKTYGRYGVLPSTSSSSLRPSSGMRPLSPAATVLGNGTPVGAGTTPVVGGGQRLGP